MVVLRVKLKTAADATIGANSLGDVLVFRPPIFRLAKVKFSFELKCVGGTNTDAIAAIDTCRIGQWDFVLGGDAGVVTPSSDGDRERVLRVIPASFNAFVAEDTAVVGANE